ncbi:hypothetical protein DPMN_010235 [Dreissena polymorpha]|uniref:Uncharacterized protein n=2 Tax=Dreissena polymorpha TaxID=45954 RepID=A0A9D4N2T4_DREPO|nr:hypothetical protein DPMN_010235 [Dreissena polymorpha]
MLYLVRLAEKCHVNLPEAVMKKIQQNRNKYPASVVYGRSEKYTEYAHGTKISHEIADETRKLDNGSNS